MILDVVYILRAFPTVVTHVIYLVGPLQLIILCWRLTSVHYIQ